MRLLGPWLFLVLLLLSGCGGCHNDSTAPETGGGGGRPEDNERQTMSIVEALPSCDVDHRGLLLDLGSGILQGRAAYSAKLSRGIVLSEHDGSTWVRMFDRSLNLTFYMPTVAPVFAQLRALGKDSSKVTLSIDGYALGTVRIGRDEIEVSSTRTSSLPLDAGMHTLNIRFRGNKHSDAEPFGEIDWIRIGIPDELKRTYGAPTMDDVLMPAAQLAGVPHRGLSLRAPGVIRCALRVPAHGRLRVAVGMAGEGAATAAIVVRRDGEDAAVLQRVDVSGGPDAAWTDVEVPLHPFASEIVALELEAIKTTGTGRLMFGDPVVVTTARPEVATPPARAAVVVVLSGVTRTDLPPWRETETPHLPTLNELAKTATIFNEHRAPSTLVSATVASLITGLSPRAHALADRGARLPDKTRNIAALARESSVRAAMFTGVPTTFAPFGFEQSWDTFEFYPANQGRMASAPMDDAAAWINETPVTDEAARPMFALLHARGGHPPFEVTSDDARKLPPDDYTGYFGPRTAAQTLAKLEGRHSRLSDQDEERMRALFMTSLSGQDEALGKLIRALEDADRWDSTLFVVMGDVSTSRSQLFQDGLPIDESLLSVPLYVHFPGGAHAGMLVQQTTEVYDVTRTVLTALGLKQRAGMQGTDLAAIASGSVEDVQRIRVAITDANYSVRWGDFVLHGEIDKRPALCRLSVDPTCSYDRRHDFPLVWQAMFRRYAAFETAVGTPPDRQPLELDADAAAMLNVWGSY